MSDKDTRAAAKERNAAGAVLLALAAYSVLAFAVLLIFGKLIPTPLAEYMAFAYTYGKAGKCATSALFALLYAVSAVLCAVMFKPALRKKPYLKIPAALLVFADLAVHGYAFLFANGYQWIYLFCALLDAAMLFCIVYESAAKRFARKREKTNEGE